MDYDNFNLLAITDNLADAQRKLRHRDEAEALYNKILDVKTQNWGSDHPETLDTMTKLANFYEEDTYIHINRAVSLYERLLETKKQVLGTGHPDTIRAQHDLAHAYFKQEDYPRALAAAELLSADSQVISDFEAGSNSKSEAQRNSYHQLLLAKCYQTVGRYSESEKLLKGAMGTPTLHGTNDALLLACLYWMGALRKRQERFDEAEEYFKRALTAYMTERHSLMDAAVGCVEALVDLHSVQNMPSKGETVLRGYLADVERMHGNDSLATADAVVHLALFYEAQERWEDASECMTRALEIRGEKLGCDHHDCLVPIQGLALCADILGTGDRGAAMYARAIPGLERRLGSQHPDTVVVMKNLLNVLHSQEKRDEEDALLDHCAEHGVHFRRLSEIDEERSDEDVKREEHSIQVDAIGDNHHDSSLRNSDALHRRSHYRQSKL